MAWKLSEAFVEIYAKMDSLKADLAKAQGEITNFAAGNQSLMSKAGAAFANFGQKVGGAMKGALSAAWGFFGSLKTWIAGGALSYAIQQAAAWGSALLNLSAKTGMSTEALGTLQYMAKLTGASIGDLQTSMRSMANAVDAARMGTEEGVRTLDRLGVSVGELQGMKPEEMFWRFARAISALPDPMERMALAQDVFGRGALDMLPILTMNAGALADLARQAQEFGVAASAWKAVNLNWLDDSIQQVKSSLWGLWTDIVARIAPSLAPILQDIAFTRIPAIRKSLEQIDFGSLVDKSWKAIAGAMGSVKAFFVSVWEAVTRFIVGTIEFLRDPIGKIREWMGALSNWVQTKMSALKEWGIAEAIDAFEKIKKAMFDPAKWAMTLNALQNPIGAFFDYIQRRIDGIRVPVLPAWMASLMSGGVINPGMNIGARSGAKASAGSEWGASNSAVGQGIQVSVHVAGTAGESPETFAKRVAQAVNDGLKLGGVSAAAMLARP